MHKSLLIDVIVVFALSATLLGQTATHIEGTEKEVTPTPPTKIDKPTLTPSPLSRERPTPTPIRKTVTKSPTATPLNTRAELQRSYEAAVKKEAQIRGQMTIGLANKRHLAAAVAKTLAAKKALDKSKR